MRSNQQPHLAGRENVNVLQIESCVVGQDGAQKGRRHYAQCDPYAEGFTKLIWAGQVDHADAPRYSGVNQPALNRC